MLKQKIEKQLDKCQRFSYNKKVRQKHQVLKNGVYIK
jgi:hypothetical protein